VAAFPAGGTHPTDPGLRRDDGIARRYFVILIDGPIGIFMSGRQQRTTINQAIPMTKARP
jgi:hypothetical protein